MYKLVLLSGMKQENIGPHFGPKTRKNKRMFFVTQVVIYGKILTGPSEESLGLGFPWWPGYILPYTLLSSLYGYNMVGVNDARKKPDRCGLDSTIIVEYNSIDHSYL